MKVRLVVVIALLLAGCNTVAGVGEDVTGGARAVQNMLD